MDVTDAKENLLALQESREFINIMKSNLVLKPRKKIKTLK